MKLRGKLLVCSIPALVILAVVVCIYGSISITSAMKEEVKAALQAAVYTERGNISNATGNDFKVVGDVGSKKEQLYNGDVNITAQTDVPNLVKKNTEIVLTVFYDNKPGDYNSCLRYMTSVTKDDGSLALYTAPGEAVYNKVVKNGEEYFAENVDVVGSRYFAYYIPLYNGNDTTKPIGMVFSGKSQEAVESTINGIIIALIIVAAVITIIAGVLIFFIAGSLSKKFRYGVKVLGEVADGNLAVEIEDKYTRSKDESGEIVKSVAHLKNELSSIVGNIVTQSNQVNEYAGALGTGSRETATSIEQVEHAVNEIAIGATAQAGDTAKATDSVITMGNLVEETNDNVEHLHSVSNEMEQSGKNAANTLTELKNVNEKAKASIAIIYEQTNTTNESAKKISEAISLITSIAEETNLLSLNASIEAARAGEQGRGFAVVASQISKLAEQSNDSAKRIADIINLLMEDSKKAVDTMDEVNAIMVKQNEMVELVDSKFGEVMDGINQSREDINDISKKMVKLNESRESVVDVVSNLSAIAEENAASTEETSASTTIASTTVQEIADKAGALKDIATDLGNSVKVFKL